MTLPLAPRPHRNPLLAAVPARKRQARGRTVRHVAGVMNKLEAAYSGYLAAEQRAGRILHWEFEPLKLRLAQATTYSPDFLVMRPDGRLELHEVKGHWEDDARVKIKVAAERFWMFGFIGVMEAAGGGWELEFFNGWE